MYLILVIWKVACFVLLLLLFLLFFLGFLLDFFPHFPFFSCSSVQKNSGKLELTKPSRLSCIVGYMEEWEANNFYFGMDGYQAWKQQGKERRGLSWTEPNWRKKDRENTIFLIQATMTVTTTKISREAKGNQTNTEFFLERERQD